MSKRNKKSNRPKTPTPNYEIFVYIEGGTTFCYPVKNMKSAREHASEIVRTGYRRTEESGFMTHYPPHSVIKVKVVSKNADVKDKPKEKGDIIVSTYLKGDMNVIESKVSSHEDAREKTHNIVLNGLFDIEEDGTATHYPPHRILKVTVDKGVKTKYHDTVSGT